MVKMSYKGWSLAGASQLPTPIHLAPRLPPTTCIPHATTLHRDRDRSSHATTTRRVVSRNQPLQDTPVVYDIEGKSTFVANSYAHLLDTARSLSKNDRRYLQTRRRYRSIATCKRCDTSLPAGNSQAQWVPLAGKFGEPASAQPHEGLRTRISLAMAMYPTSNTLDHDNSKIVVSYLLSSWTAANASSTFSLSGYAVAWGRSPYPSHMDQQVRSRRRRYTSSLMLRNINTHVWQTSINQRITNSLQI